MSVQIIGAGMQAAFVSIAAHLFAGATLAEGISLAGARALTDQNETVAKTGRVALIALATCLAILSILMGTALGAGTALTGTGSLMLGVPTAVALLYGQKKAFEWAKVI